MAFCSHRLLESHAGPTDTLPTRAPFIVSCVRDLRMERCVPRSLRTVFHWG